MSTSDKIVVQINSSSRIRGTPNDFTVSFGSAAIPKPKSISVLSAELANSFLNVDNLTNKLNIEIVDEKDNELILLDSPNASNLGISFIIKHFTGEFKNQEDFDKYFDNNKASVRLQAQAIEPFFSATVYINMYGSTKRFISLSQLITEFSNAYRVANLNDANFLFSFDNTTRTFKMTQKSPDPTKWSILYIDNSAGKNNNLLGYIGMNTSGSTFTEQTQGLTNLTFNYLTQPLFKKSVYLPPNNYTPTTLSTELKNQLNLRYNADFNNFLGVNPFNVSYTEINHKLTIQFNILQLYNPNVRMKLYLNESTIDKIIGFSGNGIITGNPITGNSIVDLRGITCAYIHSSCASSFNVSSEGRPAYILQKIQISEPYGNSVFYKSYHPDLERWNISPLNDLSEMSFSLRDEHGNIIDNQGVEWTMSLLIYF